MIKDTHALPKWAPRVKPEKIRRLYLLDAQGIYDDELIVDVWYSRNRIAGVLPSACDGR